MKHLLGLQRRSGGSRLPLLTDQLGDQVQLPNNFDARKKWEECISLQHVSDQGPCGSCWVKQLSLLALFSFYI